MGQESLTGVILLISPQEATFFFLQEVKEFTQSSGEKDIVVFSLEPMVINRKKGQYDCISFCPGSTKGR